MATKAPGPKAKPEPPQRAAPQPGQMRLIPCGRSPARNRRPAPMAFRELARADGYVMARNGDDIPWVFEIDEWEGYPLIS